MPTNQRVSNSRPQPYRLKSPITPPQVENMDEMFEILFKRVRALENAQTVLSNGSSTVVSASAILGLLSDPSVGSVEDAIGFSIPGTTGPQGPPGLVGGGGGMAVAPEDNEPPLQMSIGTPQGGNELAGLVVTPVIAGSQNASTGNFIKIYGTLATSGDSEPIRFFTNSNSSIGMASIFSTGTLCVVSSGATPSAASLGSGGVFLSAIHNTASGGMQCASNAVANGTDIGYVDFGTFGTASAEKRVGAIHGFLTADATTNPTGELRFYTTAAGVIAEQLAITSAGKLRFNSTRGVIHSPANSQFTFEANAGGTGFGLQSGTADVMIVANQAQNAYAKVDCLGLKSSGVACPSFGPGAVASITVVNGLITAIA